MLADDPQNRTRMTADYGRRPPFQDGRECNDRDYKKRKLEEDMYMVSVSITICRGVQTAAFDSTRTRLNIHIRL